MYADGFPFNVLRVWTTSILSSLPETFFGPLADESLDKASPGVNVAAFKPDKDKDKDKDKDNAVKIRYILFMVIIYIKLLCNGGERAYALPAT